jgi:RNA recognition motif-containing protein
MQGSKLYVGNISFNTTNDDLKTLFSQFGEVQQVNVIQGKGFGFVEMANQMSAEAARRKLDGSDFNGRSIKVDVARPPKSRSSRGRGCDRW